MIVNGNENIAPGGGTQTPGAGPGPAFTRGGTGKIARLPLDIRVELTRRLRDGRPGKELIQWLNGLPEVQAVLQAQFDGKPISKQNLAKWLKHSFHQAVQEETIRHEVGVVLKEIGGLKETAKEGLSDQLAFYLAVQVALEFKRLKSAPDEAGRAKLRRELTANVVAVRRGDLDLERLRLQREKCGLRHKTKEELEAEFWKWAEDNINRDEFCRRRCFTYEQREAAVDKILGITPQERHETVPPESSAPAGETAGTESSVVNPGQP
jgi:hypothetical protein